MSGHELVEQTSTGSGRSDDVRHQLETLSARASCLEGGGALERLVSAVSKTVERITVENEGMAIGRHDEQQPGCDKSRRQGDRPDDIYRQRIGPAWCHGILRYLVFTRRSSTISIASPQSMALLAAITLSWKLRSPVRRRSRRSISS